jgi:serine/threonine-protein kinase
MMVTSNVRLLRPLGEGGMGAVWVAEHQSLRTEVVVKFLARDLAGSAEAIARFSREAAAASQVKSPHVVQMLDHGVLPGGEPYIVMELLEGRDLERQIRERGRLGAAEVVAVVAQLARALGKAHERGIVHRDIKPSNVFLCDAGGGELFVKLLDFGIAKGPEVGIVGSTTRTGSFIGSPYYMSPEQVVGAKAIDFRTDLWSLGVVAFEALTGKKPFYAETVGALALKIHRDPIPLPSDACGDLPEAVDAWFVRACAREPEARYASAKDLAESFARAATGESLARGARVDDVLTPRSRLGLDATQPTSLASPAASTGSGIDARSETGAGVGLVASDRAAAPRGKWLLVGAVGLVAVGVGFVVPRMRTKAPEPSAMAAPATASAPEPTAIPTLPLSLALAPAPTPTRMPTPAPAPAPTRMPTPAPAPAPTPTPTPAPAPAPTPAHSLAPTPLVSAAPPPPSPPSSSPPLPSAAPSSSPAPAPTVARLPRGSDDDIK